MDILIKHSVRMKHIYPQFFVVCDIIFKRLNQEGVETVLTSANDSKHIKNSYHYIDLGWDFRYYYEQFEFLPYHDIRHRLKNISPYFDTSLDPRKNYSHIHVEYDIRRKQKYSDADVFDYPVAETILRKEKEKMTKKQKRGTGMMVTGLAFIVSGVITGFTDMDATALPQVLTIVGFVCNVLGWPFTKPEV